LEFKITDKKFIKLIIQNFQAGIMEKGKFEHTIIGVPQGGITSPILFNIYMHEFDKYVLKYMNDLFNTININENRSTGSSTISRRYNTIRSSKRYQAKKLAKLKIKKDIYISNVKLNNPKIYNEYKEAKKEFRKRDSKQRTVKSTSNKKTKLRFAYFRYADDWILLTNASYGLNIKNKK